MAGALMAAGGSVIRAPALVHQHFPGAVLTCGGIAVEPGVHNPGVHNVAPGRTMLLVECYWPNTMQPRRQRWPALTRHCRRD